MKPMEQENLASTRKNRSKRPFGFSGGPIQGASDWQAKTCAYLLASRPGLQIADPRREKLESDFDYVEQVEWEGEQLTRAGREGVIFFWLAKEVEHHPERAFAQTSRLELGEWMARTQRDAAKLVVGIETGFPGAKYIRHRLGRMLPAVPIISADLQAACEKVLSLMES